ncbi:PAS domain-containing protein [Emcibacter sp.]|uniref:PAS domain-containing protein n=1 Tax=Emcibacter sp. TaxID=1979954 RepID=UPI002AA7AF6B|nr:PAS domain-containing protein [Emcibacter sp.]
MLAATAGTSDQEVVFSEDDIIVSKTDLKGKIIYANDTFCDVSGYSVDELIGKPHNIIRHPDMPRCIFKFMWDTLGCGEEIFAYVKNSCRDGRFYWVLAYVTPSLDINGKVCGYHSSRRSPNRRVLPKLEEIYAALRKTEQQASTPKEGMEQAGKQFEQMLADQKMTYNQFLFSLEQM